MGFGELAGNLNGGTGATVDGVLLGTVIVPL